MNTFRFESLCAIFETLRFRRAVALIAILCASFNAPMLLAGQATLTIVTHGYQPDQSDVPLWITEVRNQTAIRMGGDLELSTLRIKRQPSGLAGVPDTAVVIDDANSTAPTFSKGGVVLDVFWNNAAGGCFGNGDLVPTADIAARIFEYITRDPKFLELPIHLIGHSRGGSVMAALARLLAQRGIIVDHMTTLDPHPVQSIASGGLLSADVPCLGAIASGVDAPLTFYNNVIFHDNYFRTNGIYPDGNPVSATYEINLNTVLGDTGQSPIVGNLALEASAHSSVHTYYLGTVNSLIFADLDLALVNPAWYPGSSTPLLPTRGETGFSFSRLKSDKSPVARPASGLLFPFGERIRSSLNTVVDRAAVLYSNAILSQQLPSAFAGSSVSISYRPVFYKTNGSSFEVDVILDDNENPFDGVGTCRGFVGSNNHLAQANIDDIPPQASIQFVATSQDNNCFVRLTAINTSSGQRRHDYSLSRLQIGNTPPVADFSFSASGLAVSFVDLSLDTGGQIVARNWNFGDSTSSAATNPTKVYGAAGTYNVVLTVTDNSGASNSRSRQVTVAPATSVPILTTNAATNVSSNSATLNATISSDGGSPVLERRFEWDTSLNWTSSTATNMTGGVITVAGNTFSYVLSGLLPSTTYYFRAWARNANGWTIASAQPLTTSSGLDQTPPTAPTNLVATAVSTGQINLTWTASTDSGGAGLAGYKIQRCAGTGCTNFVQINAIAFNAYNDASGLSPGTTYLYRVQAFDNVGNASLTFSNVASAATQTASTATVPSSIAVAATNVTGNSATLNGTVTFDGGLPILERMFEWGPTPNITTVVTAGILVSGSNFSYNLTGLSANTSYTFRALARNSAGWSVVPGYLSFTTGPAPDTTPPSIPTGLVATAVSTSQIDLSWSPSTDTGGSGLSGYQVERCTGLACTTFSQIGTPTTNAYSDSTGLSSGTTYTYRVRAVDGLGNTSDYSLPADTVTMLPVDTIPPSVVSTNPANAATGVVVNGAISVVFSEPIDFYSVTNSTFVLRDNANNIVPGNAVVALTQGSFTPTTNLAFNSTYTATLTTGIKDYSGNALAADYSWSFKTRTAAASLIPKVTGPSSISTGYSVRPTIQKQGANIYVLDSNTNRDLLFYKSTDGGATFSSTVLANPVMNAEQFDFCKDDSGNLYAFYTNSNDSKVYIRRSVDAGANWTAPAAVGTGYVWMDSQACHASGTTLYVLFRAFLNLKIELYLTKSVDGGATFSAPVQITNNAIQEDWPRVVASGSNVYVIYYDQYSATPNNLLVTKSSNGGATFGAAVRVNRVANKAQGQSSMAVDSSGNLYVAYGDTSVDGGDLYVAKSSNGGASFTSGLAADSTISLQGSPRIFVDASNYVHVSWTDYRTLVYPSVYYTRSIDGGATFASNANLRSAERIENGSMLVDGVTAYFAVADTSVTPRAPLLYSAIWLTGSVPGVPTSVSAVAGNTSASVSFVAPADNGGNTITGYRVTATPGGASATGATSPIAVNGLSNGTAYTFKVTATNAVGDSIPSSASNSVVPVAPVPPQCVLNASPSTITAGSSTALSVTCVPSAISYAWTNTGFGAAQGSGNVAPAITTTYFVSGINAAGQGSATSATVTVLPATGNLTVNIVPAGATTAGAQWQLDGGPFQGSGATLTGLSPGSHTLSFKSIAGWTKPTDRTLVISAGQLLTDSGTYAAIPVQIALTIQTAGTGSGSVSYTGGFSCMGTCMQNYDAGSVVALTASAASGSTFGGWTGGGCSGQGLCTLSLSAATSVTATFSLPVATAPGAPQSPVATAGNGFISIAFTPPVSNGGTAITNYNARCNAGAATASAVSSPIVLQGLTNGAAYACTVTAVNSVGEGLPSDLVSAVPQGQLALSGVFSRKLHGAAGAFDLAVDLTKAITDAVTVEPRATGSGHNIVFQFNQPVVSLGNISVVDAVGAPVSMTPTIAGTEVILTLIGSLNTKRVTANLSGVNGSGTATASIGFLLGDVNHTRNVDAVDVGAIRARSGQPASSTNFRYDINASGVVNGSDIAAAKSRSGTVLP